MRYKKIVFIYLPILSLFLNNCGGDGCDIEDGNICKENKIYRCVVIKKGSSSSAGRRYKFLIDCAKYGAVCRKDVAGYAPVSEGVYMQFSRDCACVVPDYDCYTSDAGDSGDAGIGTACYNSAVVSCDVTPGVAVITNTVDNDARVQCP